MAARGKLTPGRIGAVAKELGEDPHVIRYWEQEFGIRPERSRSGQRCYSADDIDKLKLICRLLRVDRFTTAGAKLFMSKMKETA